MFTCCRVMNGSTLPDAVMTTQVTSTQTYTPDPNEDGDLMPIPDTPPTSVHRPQTLNSGLPTTAPTRKAQTCGHRPPLGIGLRIVEGDDGEASFGEFPWMVAVIQMVLIDDKQRPLYQCGGSLLTPQVVLTSARCLAK